MSGISNSAGSFLFVVCLLSQPVSASSSGVIHRLLSSLNEKSNTLKIADHLNISSQLTLDTELFVFEPTAFIRGSYSNQDIVPTSPFTPSNTEVKEYEIGVSKQWDFGVKSDLSYLYQDSATIFPARSNFFFQAPTLQLSLTTSIFKDLVHNRYDHLIKSQNLSKSATDLKTKVEKKAIMVQALLSFSSLLEQSQTLELQKDICKQTRTQSRHLRQKRKRGSVSAREYLQGEKELTSCLATIDNLEKNITEAKENFAADYNISYDDFSGVSTDELFDEAERLYLASHSNANDVDLDNQDEIKSLSLQINALEAKQAQLDAESSTNLALEVRSGLAGIGDDFSNSNRDLTDVDYPFIYLGLKLDLPLKDRTAVAKAGANRYQLKANRLQKAQLENEKQYRFETLEKTLAKDFEIYEKYKKTVNLSKNIIKEGRKDFVNGRLDFNSLTELNKSLLVEQRTLSSHRTSLIVRVVEYLDFYQFFDTYLK